MRTVALVVLLLALTATPTQAADPIQGTASEYGPGNGVAMPFCTWILRHQTGCGWVRLQSLDTGVTVVVAVIDWCQCYVGSADERIVDLQYGVVDALGLDRSRGLYPVQLERLAAAEDPPPLMPDTSTR